MQFNVCFHSWFKPSVVPSWCEAFRFCGAVQCQTDLMVWSCKASFLLHSLTSAQSPDVSLCLLGLCSPSLNSCAALWTLCRSDGQPLCSSHVGRPSTEPAHQIHRQIKKVQSISVYTMRLLILWHHRRVISQLINAPNETTQSADCQKVGLFLC